jgi:tRNA nucleotidyltransferase (CCA-adding enzyme)
MAVQLNREHFGELLDFFGGRDDLEKGIVRVLHNLSFVEDPTRIIRAVRFEQRYGFAMDRQTEMLISRAADIELFSRLTRERMRDELILLLSEQDPISATHRMAHLDILKHIHPKLRFDEEVYALLGRVREELSVFVQRQGSATKLVRWVPYLLSLLEGLSLSEVKAVAREMKLGERIGEMVRSACIDAPAIEERLKEHPTPSQVRRLLLPLADEVLVYTAARSRREAVRSLLHQHLYEWSQTKPDVTGEVLLQRGLSPGPHIGRALNAALDAKLDGAATTPQEQLEIALKHDGREMTNE